MPSSAIGPPNPITSRSKGSSTAESAARSSTATATGRRPFHLMRQSGDDAPPGTVTAEFHVKLKTADADGRSAPSDGARRRVVRETGPSSRPRSRRTASHGDLPRRLRRGAGGASGVPPRERVRATLFRTLRAERSAPCRDRLASALCLVVLLPSRSVAMLSAEQKPGVPDPRPTGRRTGRSTGSERRSSRRRSPASATRASDRPSIRPSPGGLFPREPPTSRRAPS